MLLFDMNMSQSRATGKFQSIDWATRGQKVQRNAFSQNLIDAVQAMGLRITLVDNWASEYWIGLRIEPQGFQRQNGIRRVIK
jgi:hypothetical protein